MRMPLCHSIFRCARLLDPCTAASPGTRKSCPCSRQALPGRVSLSGNVPTEQPTLALTLCPFRGVLWREPCLFPSHSLPFPISLTPADSLSFPHAPIRPSNTISLPPPFYQSLSLSLPPFVSPTLRRLVLRFTARVSLSS